MNIVGCLGRFALTLALSAGAAAQTLANDAATSWPPVASSPGPDKAVHAGSAGLTINSSGRIELISSQPISYLNRPVANGRRVVRLRVGQALLCADFAAPPSAGANPVALEYLDPNGDSSGLLFGGMTNMSYVSNGPVAALFKITASANLACCTMLPALNASCVQGVNGGAPLQAGFSAGTPWAKASSASTDGVQGSAADLAVNVSGPTSIAPGATLTYSIVVSNVGGTAVSGVRVRDWFPKASGGYPASFGNGQWNCASSAGASCATASGNGNIALNAVSLNPGSTVTFTVLRPMAGVVPNGTQTSLSAAAFAPPSANETVLGNNQDAHSVVIQGGVPVITSFTAPSVISSCAINARHVPSSSAYRWTSTGAAYCRATEDAPTKTNWSAMGCTPNNGPCPAPVPDTRSLQANPADRPEPPQGVLVLTKPNQSASTTLTLTCYSETGQASVPVNRTLSLSPTSSASVCGASSVVPATTVSTPVPQPNGSFAMQSSVSNPQGLPLTAAMSQQGNFGTATVTMVGNTVSVRYYPGSGISTSETNSVTDTIRVIIEDGNGGTEVTYTFQVEMPLFSNGFEGGGTSAAAVEENFDGVTGSPTCPQTWMCLNLSSPLGSTTWFQGASAVFPAQSGAPASYLAADVGSAAATGGTVSNWLVSPPVTFSSGNELRFWTRSRSLQRADRLEIRASTAGANPGTTANSVGDFTILLGTINPSLIAGAGNCTTPAAAPGSGAYPAQWCEYRITNLQGLPTSGSGRIAFRYQVTGAGASGANSDYIGIDTVRLGLPQ